jgi:hypothetical protein
MHNIKLPVENDIENNQKKKPTKYLSHFNMNIK